MPAFASGAIPPVSATSVDARHGDVGRRRRRPSEIDAHPWAAGTAMGRVVPEIHPVQRSSAAASRLSSPLLDEAGVFECGIEPLASLYGMPLFNDLAEARFSEARRHGFIASLICVEMDDFAEIRGRHGRLVADAAMLSVAELLRLSLRREDMVALRDDATFVILLMHCDGVSAHAKAESLRLAISSMDPTGIGLTVSVGGAAGVTGPGLRFDLLMTRATDALASARARGGDGVVFEAAPHVPRVEMAFPGH